MQHLTANFSGSSRRERLSGQEHLVVPVTIIVPGVLNGNRGPILYTADENRKNIEAWNHVPLTDDHPHEEISARTEKVLKNQWLGILLNTHANDEGELKGEAWFNIAATEARRPGSIKRMESGEKIELSTGLGMDTDEESGVTNSGEKYVAKAQNYKPDHLAILFDKRGACSLKDGCGVNNSECCSNNTDEMCDNCLKRLENRGQDEPNHQNNEEDPKKGEDRETKGTTINSSNVLKGSRMADFDREQVVDGLITNCDCWTEKDRDTLNGLSDDQLKRHAKQEAKRIANEKELEKLTSNASPMDEEEDEEETKNKKKKEEGEVMNSAGTEMAETPKTVDEFFASAPPEVREVFNQAKKIADSHRNKLVERLVANAEEGKREGLKSVYNSMETDTLESLVDALPQEKEDDDQTHNYFGSANVNNSGNSSTTSPIPSAPVIFN